MPKDLNRSVIVGLVLIGLGLLAILLGYNGAARLNYVDGQLPFVVSGGILGLALIIVGTGLLVFESMRRGRVHIEEKLDAVIEALRGYSPNGTGTVPGATESKKKTVGTAALNGMVVVGRSSFHLPGCRLVEGKDEARGLQPCRVCEPKVATAGKKR